MVPRCFYFQSNASKRLPQALLERFIDGLPPIFAHKVKQMLMGKNDSIDYDNLTYGDIFSAIKKLGINMCNDEKLLKYHLQHKKKAIYIYIYIV